MRILSLVLAFSVTSSTFTFSSAAVGQVPSYMVHAPPMDQELAATLRDLNQRYRIVKQVNSYEMGLIGLAGMGLSAPGLMIVNKARRPKLYATFGLIGVTSWLAAVAGALFIIKAHVDDRLHNSGNRVLSSDAAEYLSKSSLWALRDFFNLSQSKQYILATENPDLRRYLIEFGEWMAKGVLNGQPPAPLSAEPPTFGRP